MKQEELIKLIEPIVDSLGIECLGVEYVAHRTNGLLRIYIDVKAGGDREINLDDCEAVSREISSALDVADLIVGRYTLEVSSPGIARPLFKVSHFQRFIGNVVKTQLSLPLSGRRRFQGMLQKVEGDKITINQDGVDVVIEHGLIQKAHLVPDYSIFRPEKPGKGSKPGKSKRKSV
jgi:ribosome maturation factor RimP